MTEIVDRHRRYGLPRVHWLLQKGGLVKNFKKTRRIYREMKLQLKNRKGKKKGKCNSDTAAEADSGQSDLVYGFCF